MKIEISIERKVTYKNPLPPDDPFFEMFEAETKQFKHYEEYQVSEIEPIDAVQRAIENARLKGLPPFDWEWSMKVAEL